MYGGPFDGQWQLVPVPIGLSGYVTYKSTEEQDELGFNEGMRHCYKLEGFRLVYQGEGIRP